MRSSIFLLALLLSTAHVQGENWPNWRGPDGNSVAPAGAYPTQWSNEDNVQWKLKLPGKGSSTPAVWEDNIFVTYNRGTEANLVACLDRAGKEKWKVELGSAVAGKYGIASGANPSPVTDGTHLYVFFKSGELACLGFDGDVVWRANLQKLFGADTNDTIWWDMGTSPVLAGNSLVIAYQRSAAKKEGEEKPPVYSDNSFVVSFDCKSGEVNWKEDRNLDAPRESAQSYTTPLVVGEAGEQAVLVLGADYVTAHDVASGKELWKFGTLNPNHEQYWRSIASAAIADGYLFAPYARGGTLTAIKLGGKGNVTQTHAHWTVPGISSDCATPIAVNGKVYSGTDRGKLTCVDIPTGKTLWQMDVEKSGKRYKSSPILSGDKLYWAREDGVVFVVDVGDKPEVVGKNVMGEQIVATPVLVDGQLLLRTLDNLYLIGK